MAHYGWTSGCPGEAESEGEPEQTPTKHGPLQQACEPVFDGHAAALGHTLTHVPSDIFTDGASVYPPCRYLICHTGLCSANPHWSPTHTATSSTVPLADLWRKWSGSPCSLRLHGSFEVGPWWLLGTEA